MKNTTAPNSSQTQIQKALFEDIREKCKNKNTSFVDEIAELLSVSNDSSYRRIRCEKLLTIDELEKVCKHYKLSFDKYLEINKGNALFNYSLYDNNVSIEVFLDMVLKDLEALSKHEDHMLIYSIKDFPLFHIFEVPELASFLLFFWMKSLFQLKEYESLSFSFDIINPLYLEKAKKISVEYKKVNSHEIWNTEILQTILARIEYYNQSKVLSKKDALLLLDKIKVLINHIKKEAEQEKKFDFKSKELPIKSNYNLYLSEIIVGDNSIYTQVGDNSKCYIPHALLYYISTYDKNYGKHMFSILSSVMKKAALISGVAEKYRTLFFNSLIEKVETCEVRIK